MITVVTVSSSIHFNTELLSVKNNYTSECIIVALIPGSPLTPFFITLCQGTVEESGNEASIIMW